MSRVDSPLHREPVVPDGRAMSPARRARILARDKHCKYPGCELTERLEVDHIVALDLGGKDADWNLQALCYDHHKQKTRQDRKLIAKVRRQRAKADGTFPESKAKIRSRGFAPSRPWSEGDE